MSIKISENLQFTEACDLLARIGADPVTASRARSSLDGRATDNLSAVFYLPRSGTFRVVYYQRKGQVM